MDEYHPHTVFSSIDRGGRYAYANQPAIAQWNLARFAETLLALIAADGDEAVRLATGIVEPFIAQFEGQFLDRMRRKVGLASALDGDAELVNRLLTVMQEGAADFTLTFRRLALAAEDPGNETQLRELFRENPAIDSWLQAWRQRLAQDPQHPTERATSMRRVNAAFIQRNHRVEAALNAAADGGDLEPFRRLLDVVQRPYDDQPDAVEYEQPPQPAERVLKTFCGT